VQPKPWTPEDGYVVWRYVKLNSRTGWETYDSDSYVDLFEAVDCFMEIQWERVHDPNDHRLEIRIAKKGDVPANEQAIRTHWPIEHWLDEIKGRYELYDSYYEVGVRAYFS
jgi:hypothetical protein